MKYLSPEHYLQYDSLMAKIHEHRHFKIGDGLHKTYNLIVFGVSTSVLAQIPSTQKSLTLGRGKLPSLLHTHYCKLLGLIYFSLDLPFPGIL